MVQKELSHLDDLLSIDVQILRDKIDDACRDYDAAQYVGLNDTIIWQWHFYFYSRMLCTSIETEKHLIMGTSYTNTHTQGRSERGDVGGASPLQ